LEKEREGEREFYSYSPKTQNNNFKHNKQQWQVARKGKHPSMLAVIDTISNINKMTDCMDRQKEQ